MRPLPRAATLELALFKRLRATISELLGDRPRAHLAYEARYRKSLPVSLRERLGARALSRALSRADVVFVGDYFTFAPSQQAFAALVEADATPRPLVVALSSLSARKQGSLDAFARGAIGLERLRRELGLGAAASEARFRHLLPVLSLCRSRRIELLALDAATDSLEAWDAQAARRIARRLAAGDQARLYVLAGQFHIAPPHLPRAVASLTGAETAIVFQSFDEHFYGTRLQASPRARSATAPAACLREGQYLLWTGSPLECAQSFLEQVELERGDRLLEGDVALRFAELARQIAEPFGIEIGPALAELTVAGPAELETLVAHLRGLPPRIRGEIERHVLSRESGFFPGARLVYLAHRSLDHAAEEAAHFVRACAAGDIARPRSMVDAFYARTFEEAFAFFGSRQVNPARRCPSPRFWQREFEDGGELREVAAYVLAQRSARGPQVAALLPLHDRELFGRVSHALGYLLGEAMDRAWRKRPALRPGLIALLRDPLPAPREAWLSWSAQLRRA